MPTLEPQDFDQEYSDAEYPDAEYADTEYAVTDPDLKLPPERPERIPVPPIMLWGALWLMAISVTIAATSTLLLPRRLNPSPPNPTAVNDVPAQVESLEPEAQDSESASANASAPAAAEALPEPPTAAADTPEVETAPNNPASTDSTSTHSTPDNSETPASATTPTEAADTQTNATELQPSAATERLFPLRLLLLVTAGCAFTSLAVTLLLRGMSQNAAPRAARRERLAASRQGSTQHPTQSPTQRPTPSSIQSTASRYPAASPVSRMQRNGMSPPVMSPTVMVLPPEAVTPLDGIPTESFGDLAAQLDIRRRYSLSSLIEEDLDSV